MQPSESIFSRTNILALSLLLVVFRLPLMGILKMPDYGRYFLLLPLGILLLTWNRRLSLQLCIVFLCQVFFASIYFYVEISSATDFATLFLSRFAMMLTVILGFEWSREQLQACLYRVAVPIVIFGSFFSIFESIGYRLSWWTEEDFLAFLDSGFYGLRLTSHFRSQGILADPSATGLLLLCASLVAMVLTPNKTLRNIYCAIGFTGVLFTGTFIQMFAILFIVIFRLNATASLKKKGFWVGGLVLISTPLFFQRFASYYVSFAENLLRIYFPMAKDCSGLNWIGTSNLADWCPAPEIHLLKDMYTHGLLLLVPFFIFCFMPLPAVLQSLKAKELKATDALIPFYFSVVHYGGFERWGLNYIFGLLVALILNAKDSNSPASSSYSKLT